MGAGVGVSYAPNGALICQPRATPGGRGCSMDNAPEGGKRITAHHCRVAKGVREIIILLPFLGECWLRTIPKPSLFLYVGKELWSFLSATYSQFRRICYPPAWSMRIYYPINYEEPTPTLPKGGGRVLLSFCLIMRGVSSMSFCPSVSCLSVLLSDNEGVSSVL